MTPYSILMFCFSGALLLYAALIAITKDYKMIPRNWAAKPRDGKEYASRFAKIIALVAAAPLLSGAVALFGDSKWIMIAAAAALIGGIIGASAIGVRLMKDQY